MSTNWMNVNEKHSSNFVGNTKQEVHSKGKDNFPVSKFIYPPTNYWAGVIRNKPVSSIPTNFVNSQVDFNINPPGFTKRFLLDINVTNTSGAAINILPHYLILKIEWMDGNQNVLSTQYDDSIYLHKIHQGYEDSKRLQVREGINISTYNNDVPLAAGASREYILHIPSFIDATEQNLNSLNDKMLVRIYFQGRGTDTPSALQLNSCDFITEGLILEPSHLKMLMHLVLI